MTKCAYCEERVSKVWMVLARDWCVDFSDDAAPLPSRPPEALAACARCMSAVMFCQELEKQLPRMLDACLGWTLRDNGALVLWRFLWRGPPVFFDCTIPLPASSATAPRWDDTFVDLLARRWVSELAAMEAKQRRGES